MWTRPLYYIYMCLVPSSRTHGRRRWGHWTFPLGTAGSLNPWSRASTPQPQSWYHGCSPRQSEGRYLEDRQDEINHVLVHLKLCTVWPSGDHLTSLKGVLDVVDFHLWSWHPEYALMLKTWWEQKGVCLEFISADMDEKLMAGRDENVDGFLLSWAITLASWVS